VAAIVAAERLTDTVATLLLGAGALASWTGTLWALAAPVAAVALLLGLVRNPGWAALLARRLGPRRRAGWRGLPRRLLQDGLRIVIQTRHCTRGARLAFGVGTALALQLTEGAGLAWLLHAAGEDTPLLRTVVAYGLGLFLGSTLPIPGGVGSFEAGLAGTLTAGGVDEGIAVAAALLVRLVTVWAMVPAGLVALGWGARRAA
jgi:uncharacterized membrane protein YbhN (UPF0104 family)